MRCYEFPLKILEVFNGSSTEIFIKKTLKTKNTLGKIEYILKKAANPFTRIL